MRLHQVKLEKAMDGPRPRQSQKSINAKKFSRNGEYFDTRQQNVLLHENARLHGTKMARLKLSWLGCKVLHCAAIVQR